MSDFDKDIVRQTRELQEFMDNDLLDIIEVEGLNHFEESFDNEGFTDKGLEPWKPRKTTDKKGRDITRYRTNRRGKAGKLNKYGKKIKGKKVLNIENKLRQSINANKVKGGVQFSSDKPYAERHNEGKDDMPKRQFMGASAQLNKQISKKIDKTLDKIFDK